MSKTTTKITKKIEQRINERALFFLLTEKIDLDEVSINWLEKLPVIGKAFAKERGNDERTGDEPTQDPKITKVNIPLPIPDEEKATILKNPEVQNLLKAFFARWNISSASARNDFMKAVQVDPTNTIKRYTLLAAVDNEATQGDEKSKAIEPDDPENPTGDSGQEGEPGKEKEKTGNSFLDATLKDRAQYLVKNIGTENFKTAIDKTLDDLLNQLVAKDPEASRGGSVARKRLKNRYVDTMEVISSEMEKVLSKVVQESTSLSLSYPTRMFINSMYESLIKEQLAITNLAETDVAELVNEINKFYPYAKEYLGFDRPVELTLISDPDNAKDTFGKTAYYSPANEQMTIFVDGRHPKDIIRSFSHELVHHAQNCRGEFDRDFNVGENYIETDDHLREMEREAYDKGNMCLRTYESYLKKENKTMNEQTLRKSIREAIKRVVETKTTEEAVEEAHCPASKRDYMEEDTVTEDSGEEEAWHQWKNEHADDDHIKEIEHHLRALKGDRDHERDEAEYDHDKYEDEGMEEGLKDTGLTGVDGDDDGKTYDDHFKKDAVDEDKAYTAKKEKPGADKRKGAEKRGAEGTLAKTKGHGKVDYVNEEEGLEEDEDYTAKKEKPGDDKRKGAEKRGAEGTLAKTKGHGKVDYVNEEETTTPLNESMAARKGQIVFDKLVKKWCK